MKKLKVLISALFLLLPFTSNATLIGTQVGCSISPSPNWVCSQSSNTIGAGVEFELDLPQSTDSFGFSVDIYDTSILISNIEDNVFGLGAGELFTLTFDVDILGISSFLASDVTVISSSSISYLNNILSIDLNNDSVWQVGSFVSFNLDVNTVTGPGATPAPEPTPLVLLGLGLVGIGYARKKRAV
ncbi:PEP-CTERM sorting domain-containing protein [Paraglaciecola aquimarina]|uniref:PEP-CTERM sorting domain-containing protein n=1 Tax=Paraglaciecola algarum TaxID=3050085 RepID=A0ABS9DAD6_9ALTE|nr:PEP-CTERM sorting domain-containing protein [Paraglaciecola sp. G1-23]MCF2949921.1 PEP-CTERM sorting domain-containing protein [Paraglaciecola sp. G1-23]